MADVWPQLMLVVGEVGGRDSASVREGNVLMLEIAGRDVGRSVRMPPSGLLGGGGVYTAAGLVTLLLLFLLLLLLLLLLPPLVLLLFILAVEVVL